jgi:hypothetical protein
MDSIKELDWLRKRLDAIVLLLLEAAPGGADSSTTRKIERLLSLGFSQSEVAQVLGKKPNYVTAVIATKKKAEGVAKKKGQAAAAETPT